MMRAWVDRVRGTDCKCQILWMFDILDVFCFFNDCWRQTVFVTTASMSTANRSLGAAGSLSMLLSSVLLLLSLADKAAVPE